LWKNILLVTKNFALMGFIIAYMQLIVDSIATFFPGELEDKPVQQIRFFMAMPMFCVLSMLTNLKQLMPFATLGVLAVIAKCGCMMVGGVWVFWQTPACSALETPDITSVDVFCREYTLGASVPSELLPGAAGKYLALFLFNFAILTTVPSVRSQLADPSQMHAVLSKSFLIIVSIDCSVMALGYLGFGVSAPENIITGLAEEFPILGQMSAVSMMVNVLISAPLFFFCIISVFEASGGGSIRTPLSRPNIAFRISLTVILTFIGDALPYVTEVLGLVASVFSCCNNILFPAAFHYLSRRQAGLLPKNPQLRSLKYHGAVVVGLLVLVFGAKGSLSALLRKINDANEEVMASANVTVA